MEESINIGNKNSKGPLWNDRKEILVGYIGPLCLAYVMVRLSVGVKIVCQSASNRRIGSSPKK